MKMTARATKDGFFLIDESGTEHEITTHRPTFWLQGVVYLPDSLAAPGVVIMQDPSDEESAMMPIEEGVHHPDLADLQRRWAAGELVGEFPIELTLGAD
jgi:hypothetical protein